MSLASRNITAEASAHERYLFKPFYGSSHLWALSILRDISVTSRVLDIGAGSGAIGRTLKESGVTELYAIEIDEKAAEHIGPIYKRVEDSIDAYEGQKFDVILLLDVLEHLTIPADFLRRVAELLSDGGIVLISVPNIAHWSVRIPLLFGIFNYQERGILDKTHYHFFTLRHLREMVTSVQGVKIECQSASIEPIEFLLPERVWRTKAFRFFSRARLAIAETFPGLFAYQLLLKLRK
jgi:SAM-dependent methyltransferase